MIQIRSFKILLFALIVWLRDCSLSSSGTCMSLTFMNFLSELSFRGSFTKRRILTFAVSEVQPKFTCQVSFSDSVHRLQLGDNFSYHNSHINSLVRVLILGLDVLVSWLIFSWVINSISLCSMFLMTRGFSTSTLLTTFSSTRALRLLRGQQLQRTELRYHVRIQVRVNTCQVPSTPVSFKARLS